MYNDVYLEWLAHCSRNDMNVKMPGCPLRYDFRNLVAYLARRLIGQWPYD